MLHEWVVLVLLYKGNMIILLISLSSLCLKGISLSYYKHLDLERLFEARHTIPYFFYYLFYYYLNASWYKKNKASFRPVSTCLWMDPRTFLWLPLSQHTLPPLINIKKEREGRWYVHMPQVLGVVLSHPPIIIIIIMRIMRLKSGVQQ